MNKMIKTRQKYQIMKFTDHSFRFSFSTDIQCTDLDYIPVPPSPAATLVKQRIDNEDDVLHAQPPPPPLLSPLSIIFIDGK